MAEREPVNKISVPLTLRFTWIERLRLLMGRPAEVLCVLACARPPGEYATHEITATVPPIG